MRFEKKFKPTSWLSFLLGNTLWIDLSDPPTYDVQFNKFIDSISDCGALARMTEEEKIHG